VLAEDPHRMGLVRAVRYVMRVPTNAMLIVGSAFGFFFFGLQTSALLFVRGRYQSVRTLLRSLAQAVAPLAFGGCADLVAGIAPARAPVGTGLAVISPGAARGLEFSFLSCSARWSPRPWSCSAPGRPTPATWRRRPRRATRTRSWATSRRTASAAPAAETRTVQTTRIRPRRSRAKPTRARADGTVNQKPRVRRSDDGRESIGARPPGIMRP